MIISAKGMFMDKTPIWYGACPRCGGTVTAEDVGEGDGTELFCIVCGNRRDFIKVNTMLNIRNKLITKILNRP